MQLLAQGSEPSQRHPMALRSASGTETDRKTTENHLIRAAEMVRSARLHRLKLYEMVGLPGETMEDINELVRFSLELSKIAPLSLGISPFVAKRNTPLDGAPFEPVSSITAKLARIRAGLKGKADVRPSSAALGLGGVYAFAGRGICRIGCDGRLEGRRQFSAWKRAFAVRAALLFFVCVVLLFPMLSLPLAQGAESAPQREESQFGIYVAGKEIGYEKFSILSSTDTIESKSVVSFQDPGGKHKKVKMETQLSMDRHFLPRAYQLRTDVEGKE